MTITACNTLKPSGLKELLEIVPRLPNGVKNVFEITFLPSNRKVAVPRGTTVKAAAQQAGIIIRGECGGHGRCGKCLVALLADGQPLTPIHFAGACSSILKDSEAHCLSCQTLVDRPMFVVVPAELDERHIPEGKTGNIVRINQALRGLTDPLQMSKKTSLGIALDIGTTTIAAYLCDKGSGKVITAKGAFNPQCLYGADVISRISLANQRPDGLKMLQKAVVEAVNQVIRSCLKETRTAPDDVNEVVVAGNTTMEFLFAGMHPRSLGEAPYMPAVKEFPDQRAGDLGLALALDTPVQFFPVKTGFIGGDLLAAIFAEGAHQHDGTCLLIDIGTNGEAALITPQSIWVISCATGPAFEGGQLECGMRASAGAIYKVTSSLTGKGYKCHVVGEDEGEIASGICGSGVIDAVAEMYKAGVIQANGRFNEKQSEVILDAKGVGRKMMLVPPEKSRTQTGIFITLHDIRQIQLAKAALAVGIEALLRAADVVRVDKTVLTGAFGARFDWRNAITIGMLPESILNSRVEVAENLAGLGAIRTILNQKKRYEIKQIHSKMCHIELADQPGFSEKFAKATCFPRILS